jgi:hypothetical protein
VSIPGRWEWVGIVVAAGARHGDGSGSASHLPWHVRFDQSTSGRWEQVDVATAARVRHGDGTWGAGRVADGGRHGGGPRAATSCIERPACGNEPGAHLDESSCHGLDGDELHGGWIWHVWEQRRLWHCHPESRRHAGSGAHRSEWDGGGGAGEKQWRHVGEGEAGVLKAGWARAPLACGGGSDCARMRG